MKGDVRGRIERAFALVFVPEMSFKFLGLFQVRSRRDYGYEVTVINHCNTFTTVDTEHTEMAPRKQEFCSVASLCLVLTVVKCISISPMRLPFFGTAPHSPDLAPPVFYTPQLLLCLVQSLSDKTLLLAHGYLFSDTPLP